MSFLKTLSIITLCIVLPPTLVIAKNNQAQSNVVIAEDVQWGYLNPLRGNKSPEAANLWGDRTKNITTGMLVKFNKGFSSPPHIHNISYRGIVIEGMMHNDDPKAKKMWMPPGSFWTQPAGQNHITAANGKTNLIYLEIDNGPYLVKPSDQHFNNGEKPINLHESNIVWLNQDEFTMIKGKKIKAAVLWKNKEPNPLGGTLIKLPAGFTGNLNTHAAEFRGVVIKGSITYTSKETSKAKHLLPGSYFSSTGTFKHKLTTTEQSIIYIRSNNRFQVADK